MKSDKEVAFNIEEQWLKKVTEVPSNQGTEFAVAVAKRRRGDWNSILHMINMLQYGTETKVNVGLV